MLWWPIPIRIVSCATAGACTSTSADRMRTTICLTALFSLHLDRRRGRGMPLPSARRRVAHTLGDRREAVNVQGCRICVRVCATLWQARAVRRPLQTFPAKAELKDDAPSPPRERAVVLVVDDDDAVRDALHLVLDEEYAVIEAAHGRAALDQMLAQPVDLVLLDILMPDV